MIKIHPDKYLQTLMVFIAGVLSLPALAEEEVRYYDFEVIIFESLDTTAKSSEVWKRNISREVPEVFVTLDQPYPGQIPKEYNPKYTFKYLPTSSLQLRQEAQLLEESKNYKVLLHTSWRQPGMAEEVALPIHITKRFTDTATTPFSTPQNPDMPAINLPRPVAEPAQTGPSLDGYIRIVLKRYLHAQFDLLYTTLAPVVKTTTEEKNTEENIEEPVQVEETIQYEPVIFQLNETRKMRSKEVHYLDHPVIGVIILATPFKPES